MNTTLKEILLGLFFAILPSPAGVKVTRKMGRRKHKNSMKNVDWKIVRFLEKRALDIDPATHFNPQKYCSNIEAKLQTYKTSRRAKFMMNCHIVFVTKGRCKVLFREVRELIADYLPEIVKENGWEMFACEVMPEHIHMFVSLDNLTDLRKYVQKVRQKLEDWIVKLFPLISNALQKELFSRSYFGSSIGNVSSLTVFGYIRNQWKSYTCYAEKYKIARGYAIAKQKSLDTYFEGV